jgi:hypothetical protein
MQRICIIVFAAMITAPLPAIAYTQEDASACSGDAQRLCQQAIPDEGRVSKCLHEHKRQLSPACSTVFKRPRPSLAERERSSKGHRTN